MKNKSALIIGGMGMVGRQLTKLCSKVYGEVCVVDKYYNLPIQQDLPKGVKYRQADLTFKSNASVVVDFDHVYHLAGKKGSPDTAKNSPAEYLPMLQFDTNVIEAIGYYQPEWFLYTSSIGVYPPMEIYEEDKVWHKVPSENDKVPGYIKRMGELSCYAIRATYGYENISIVRPANIYGPHDNFGENSMVIPSLIKKGVEDDEINVWGDGTPIRDFIYSEDVARGMLHMVENGHNDTVNLGSGVGVKISDIANTIGKYFDKEVKYDKSKPNGDMKRLMSMRRAHELGFNSRVKLKDGIEKTIEWYLNEI
jgi:GDP-L-fucose synthase